jgi:aldehyde dehydrogenase (NAD+)/betaine-aldehyde dehydrogenase
MSQYAIPYERMLIGGELVASESGGWDISVNPATEEPIGRAPAGTARDVERAVEAAGRAWPEWAARSPGDRAAVMRGFAQRLSERAEEFLHIEVRDTGNTITPMRGDVKMAVDSLNYYAGLVYELKGETIPGASDFMHLTVREPYGIVARIAPFNHPLMFAVARTAAALAAGNAVIVKPPETSPLSALLLAEVARECLPPGVFNIVTGLGSVVGDALVRHPEVKRIAFIGSTKTGRAIQKAAAESGIKHVTLELGGKNPLIAFADCDIDAVANAAIGGMNFAWQGQSCGSTSRLLVHADIYDAVLDRVVQRVGSIKLGDPMSTESQMGPVNSEMQHKKVMHYIGAGREDGARLMTGGSRPVGKGFERGYWVEPTVFADAKPSMRIAHEEIFGPVLTVMRWNNVEEALDIAGSVEYGLTAAIWTRDIAAAMQTARRVRAGFVWINTVAAHYPAVPFGGYKNSGIGREEGVEELYSYTEGKTINIAFGK